jgi:DNA end-binding protein Ku
MSMRHSWKGFLKLSLVTIPVKAYPALVTNDEIHLHQLHLTCQSRIKYKKTCPTHGEVAHSDIVSGYEYAQDRYVVVDPDELDKLRTESDKAIQIDAFIAMGTLDPIYSNGKSYYLAPDGPLAQRGYAVLWRGMVEEQRYAVAQVVMHGKEHIVWLRPMDTVIAMTQLCYDAQITKPAALADQIAPSDVIPEERQLLRTLMAACTPEHFDLARYQDRYKLKLSQLIEAKVAGKEIVAAPASPSMPVIDLVEALRKSLDQIPKAADASDNGQPKPTRKTAATKSKPARRRQKSKATA